MKNCKNTINEQVHGTRLIKLQIELIVPDMSLCSVIEYLNDKLYTDPEFFGDIDARNIIDNVIIRDNDVN